LIFTQLGVNNYLAMVRGDLANNPRFFGSSTSETISAVFDVRSGWNGDRTSVVDSTSQWQTRGGRLESPATDGGVFSSVRSLGAIDSVTSHRTILSGY
jgi:hypothetical protein